MFYLVLVYEGNFKGLKSFPTVALRKAYADGVLEAASAGGLDAWAAFWPEEAPSLKKDAPQAHKDAVEAITAAESPQPAA